MKEKKIVEFFKKYLNKLGTSTNNFASELLEKYKKSKLYGKGQPLFLYIRGFTSYLLKVLALFIVYLGVFYPSFLSSIFWSMIFIIAVLIFVYILFNLILPLIAPELIIVGEIADQSFNITHEIKSFIPKVILTVLAILVVVYLPSPDYKRIFTTYQESSLYYYIFEIVCILFIILIPLTKLNFILMFIAYTIVLYFLIPFILIISTNFCLETNPIFNIPFLSEMLSDKICKKTDLQKTLLVTRGKEINIPLSGGISIKIGVDKINTLPAGYQYQEVFFLTNNYKDPEDKNRTIKILSLVPYIYYPKYNLYFIPSDFINEKTFLKPNEVYGKLVVFEPQKLEIYGGKYCPHTAHQIETATKRKPECAYDIPCSSYENISSFCIETRYLECKCINWINAACSGGPLQMGIKLTHEGFIIGNGTLYYSEKYSPSSINIYSYSQGPAKISINFVPNPWIRSMYENYIDKIDMFGKIEMYGTSPKINSIEVYPVETKVIIYDYYNNKRFEETIGINKIECIDKEKINEILEKTGSWSGTICSFTPPQLKLEIFDIRKNESEFNATISLAMINDYCKQSNINLTEAFSGNLSYNIDLYREYLLSQERIKLLNDELKSTINEYGICSILKKQYESQNETIGNQTAMIENALKEIRVYVRIEYEITQNIMSSRIPIYWTSRCG